MRRNLVAILGFTLASSWVVAFADSYAAPSTAPTSTTVKVDTTMSQAEQNLKHADEFLAKNKHEKDVVTTASGLQYKILTPGTGPKPASTDSVTVDYEGKLLNGTVFDSSYKRGQPATFPVNAVIQGWQEALPLMNTGSTWEIFIPPKLAYGERGAPGAIGPNELLVFKVHLIKVNK